MQLAEEEQREINRLVAEAEAKSGAQLLLVIISKADAYPEIPWKAFAMGAAFAGLVVTIGAMFGTESSAVHPALVATALTATGAALALLAVFIPGVARLFLSRMRTEGEVRQYAQAAFLERELFATRERVGALMLVSRFECEAVIVADVGIRRHVTEEQLAAIAMQMELVLARNGVAAACSAGLGSLSLLLQGLLPRRQPSNEIAAALVEERGA